MKIGVFGTIYWNSKHESEKLKFQTKQWFERCFHYINPSKIFLTSGCYCNKDYNQIPVDLIHLNLPKTKEQSDDWNYWKVAFNTGLYQCLVDDYDIIIHCQSNFILGEQPIKFNEFLDSDKLIYAYKISSFWGTGIETAFMIMKRDGAQRYLHESIRPSLSNQKTICVEKEAMDLFRDDWFNPNHEISSLRKNIIHGYNLDSDIYRSFSLSDNEFYSLNNIVAMKHCEETDLMKWCKMHPINV